MGRKRKNDQFPKYVYLKKGRWVYVPYLGDGKLGKEIVLCPADSPISLIAKEAEKASMAGTDTHALSWLCNQFLESPGFSERAPRTQKDYRRYSARILQGNNGKKDFRTVTPATIRKYLDKGKKDGRAVQANREVAFLSIVFSWAYERDMLPRGMQNPCLKVKKNKETHRKLYVTDDAYQHVYHLATPWYIQPMMEFAFLCRLRKAEILSITAADIGEDGLFARRTKGSRDATTLWSERLRHAVDQCLDRSSSITQIDPAKRPLIHDNGQAITESAFDTAWQRLMKKAMKAGLSEPFTFHDLKKKGISDFDGDKQKAGGWQDGQMLKVYDVKSISVEATK